MPVQTSQRYAAARRIAVIAGIASGIGVYQRVLNNSTAAKIESLVAPPAYVALPTDRDSTVIVSNRRGLIGASLAGITSAAEAEIIPSSTAALVGGDVVKLNNGLDFPKASFGLQIYDDSTAQKLTETALSVGYRNFFASVLARNQRGFAKGFQASGVPRKDVFICGTVLSNRAQGFDKAYKLTKKGCDENLRDLSVGGITYVDMIMLDYPGPDCDSIKGQWKAFEEMLAAGTAKSLAVSNFDSAQLDCLLSDKTATVPTVNQLPISVSYGDIAAVEENKKRGVVVQAWAPLGGSTGGIAGNVKKVCEEIGKTYGKSWAQVALRWLVEKDVTFSTQTKSKSHFVEDLNVFDFSLSADDMAKIATARAEKSSFPFR